MRMDRMSQTTNPLPREVADAYVDELIALDPVTGTYLGVKESSSRLPRTRTSAGPSVETPEKTAIPIA